MNSSISKTNPFPCFCLVGGLIYHLKYSSKRNLWHHVIPFILHTANHHPPNFLFSWCRHLKHRNSLNFLHLQAHTIQAIATMYALSIDSTPFWWLLFHLDMLVFAPSTVTQCSRKPIH